jgi:putative transposase
MKQTPQIQSWEVSDSLWQKVEPLIPKPQRDPHRAYQRKPGGGRKPLPARQVFAGIVFVLRTGIQWKALPKERFGSPSAIHRYFLEWQAAGFFERLWQAGLVEYDEMHSIAWVWQSLDGSLTKAPLAQEAVRPNPTDREKNGSKKRLLVDGRGIPLSLVVSGAETPDVSLLPATLAERVLQRRDPGNGVAISLSGDKGYTGATAWNASQAEGYTPALQQRGQTTERIPLPAARRRRWVIERCHSWLNRFRKLTIRYEKLQRSYEGLLQLACAMICWRQTIPIYG